MSQTVPMTPEGHLRLQEELRNLIRVERPKVIQDIAEARAHGDLSENAEYDAAKNRQGFVEGRISEINGKMALSQVIDISGIDTDKVIFGATVKMFDVESEIE
ncbi:MAG: transcription elongation factor GreA, partial [Deltaproteobacteria bacterium]|nr:transcription elongation factor GreA [Deltaproteobacteria bacterium]